jgi:tetratricopeptide (TPR) repeat protein
LCAEALALVETPRLHSNLARAEAFQGNGASARRHYEEALALSEQQDTADRDERAYAALLFHYAGFLIDCGRSDVAESHLARVADSFERLGDVREKAIIQGKIADILQARGQLDEALRIRREEELPVYERLGDVRSKAVTLQKIAGIVVAQGQLEEGMNLLNQAVQLVTPLGSIRDIAVFRGGIANILQGRGQLDEALRIRREEELPVYERLGDVRERLVCQANTAFTLVARGQPEDRDEIARLLAEARAAAEGLRIPEAEQIRAIQRQLGLEGA